ncbi:unnamed protein product [Lactuca saligna]|uniref:Uncharacterized protein n=1 Tax=Lactuca saligna TaxID=75948 RepID=A0AA35YKT6_LACSI|nr:unnamed protein product [Lactuca saligna]
MFILLTNSLHRSCTEFKFLSKPGMMALALAHSGGSSHPINRQTESFIGHGKNPLPGFKRVQDVFTTTTFPQKHSTIFVVAELKKKKGRRKETLGNVGEEDHRKWGSVPALVSFFWVALVHLMAAVMGHGGDGGDEPPHPFGGDFGVHQIDARWSATIDHFLTDTHCKRSSVNKECRKKQVVKNRGGTCSYGSASFKNNLNKLEVFHRAHVNKQGEFVDPLVEEQYNALVAEVALQTQHIADSGGDPNSIDWIALFEKVLGARRGHVRGIGPKPSVVGTSAPTQWQSQSQTPQPTQDVDVNAFLQNPVFVTALGDIIRSFSKQVDNATNNDEENDDEDND